MHQELEVEAPGRRRTGLRDVRYGELLLATIDGDSVVADVYTTFTLNDCPSELWDPVDAASVAAEHGCTMVVKNGPRYWTLDSIERGQTGEFELARFAGLDMARIASVRVPLDAVGSRAYRESSVDRRALFAFDAGSAVYELVDPAGAVFVMQSYCISVDPTLTASTLAALGERLALPDGWTFRSRLLDRELVVDTRSTQAVVVQDELQNSYCLAE